MAAPLSVELVPNLFKGCITFNKKYPLSLPLNSRLWIQNLANFSSSDRIRRGTEASALKSGNSSNNRTAVACSAVHKPLLTTASLCSIIFSRNYGRKMIQKPPKITYFQYSGDLRKLPELDRSTILYSYQGLENEINNNETLKKLSSLEFASAAELANHRRQLIIDRIVELFGPNSEIEQQIALLTLGIRQMIPYCIQYRTDKGNKIWLLKRIFRRRRLLTKLREIDHERFEWLLRELKIQYVIPKDREEYKGWKHNLRVAKQQEAMAKQRQKLEALKAKYDVEKKIFFERKAAIMAGIKEDLEKFGLSKDFLEQLQKVEPVKSEVSQVHKPEDKNLKDAKQPSTK
ncbi:unnamed protein product [Lymnaea stagnalis]|uniref:Small ribosomal subunit protein uS15m n=1 Tax=Lymnaea stagnalis TaxID=6523 RepID=A0AAV2HHY3_LYMST